MQDIDDLHRLRLNAAWLVRLRWVAVYGQLLTILFVAFVLNVSLRMFWLGTLVLITATSNLLLGEWLRRLNRRQREIRETMSDKVGKPAESAGLPNQTGWAWPAVARPQVAMPGGGSDEAAIGQSLSSRPGYRLLAVVMFADLLTLTGMLYLAGGYANPFAIFYMVNLVLAAAILPEAWTWALATVALSAYATLLFFYHPVPPLTATRPNIMDFIDDAHSRRLPGAAAAGIREAGYLMAMATCGWVIIYFVARITRQLQYTQLELQRVERERARSEKVEALATLAAGAAHELATPLSTIAVVSNDLSRADEQQQLPPRIRNDLGLIRDEVRQCQTILTRMSGHAGHHPGEVEQLQVAQFLEELIQTMPGGHPIKLQWVAWPRDAQLQAPKESLAQAIRGLLHNAVDASKPDDPIILQASCSPDRLILRVIDQGSGMQPEVAARAGEPFFTTKPPGRGMGLGLFLTRSVVERMGGALAIKSSPEGGTEAVISVPRTTA